MTHPSPTRRSSELPLRRQRFDELSTLKAHDGDPANAAQLDRRAREDAELLTTLLRGQGYYDAQVTTGIGRRDGKLLVTLTADPGALYHFADVTLDGVLAAGGKADALRHAVGVKPGAAVDRKNVAKGKRVQVRVDSGGRRLIKQTNNQHQ